MRAGDIVLNLRSNTFDTYKFSKLSSGYTMHSVGDDLLYLGEFINVSSRFTNSELWKIVDHYDLPNGLVISNQYNRTYVYDGIGSFRAFDADEGMLFCQFNKGDVWTIDRII